MLISHHDDDDDSRHDDHLCLLGIKGRLTCFFILSSSSFSHFLSFPFHYSFHSSLEFHYQELLYTSDCINHPDVDEDDDADEYCDYTWFCALLLFPVSLDMKMMLFKKSAGDEMMVCFEDDPVFRINSFRFQVFLLLLSLSLLFCLYLYFTCTN